MNLDKQVLQGDEHHGIDPVPEDVIPFLVFSRQRDRGIIIVLYDRRRRRG